MEDEFRWVAQNPGDKLTSKLNEVTRSMEEKGYELVEKELVEKPKDSNNNRAFYLLHFSKKRSRNPLVEVIDLNERLKQKSNDEIPYETFEMALEEDIAEKRNNLEEYYDGEITLESMEVADSKGLLFLKFEELN